MILKELTDLANREELVDDPDFEPKDVRWLITVGAGGEFLQYLHRELEAA